MAELKNYTMDEVKEFRKKWERELWGLCAGDLTGVGIGKTEDEASWRIALRFPSDEAMERFDQTIAALSEDSEFGSAVRSMRFDKRVVGPIVAL